MREELCLHIGLCVAFFSVSERYVKLRDVQLNQNIFRCDIHTCLQPCLLTANLIRTSPTRVCCAQYCSESNTIVRSDTGVCAHSKLEVLGKAGTWN